jgi:Polyketide synthase modules and related proteins
MESYPELVKKLYTALKIAEAQFEDVKAKQNEPIAVVGMACRFPGAASVEAFWAKLCNNYDAVTKVPADRWDADYFYDERYDVPGKTYCSYGSFLDDVKGFDAAFFGITPAEARQMDPQQRILLETTWQALEAANVRPTSLAGSNTSVFLGVSDDNYSYLTAGELGETINSHFVTGNALSTASGRLSYYLGLQGVNLVINTACSSSLTAVDLGVRELRAGKTNMVIAGGVNLMLLPFGHISLSATRALSPDGRCKPFADNADGYGRGEGCGIVVLKRYSDAQRDGDNILAVIKSSAINQDGASNGMTAPNGIAQEALINTALISAGVAPHDVHYVEAHGTGTKLGDPIEIEVLQNVYGKGRSAASPLYVGAVKSNIGHLESAAGIASFIKSVLVLQHRQLPANLHADKLNTAIKWNEQIAIPTSRVGFPQAGVVIAGISSFGFSGTNVHMILQSAEVADNSVAEDMPAILLLSAKDKAALQQMVAAYVGYLSSTGNSLQDICYTAAVKREHFSYRLAVVANNKAATVQLLSKYNGDNKILYQGQHDEFVAFAERYVRSGNAIVGGLPFVGNVVSIPSYQFHHISYWVDSDRYNAMCHPSAKKMATSIMQYIGTSHETNAYYLKRIVAEITELPDEQIDVQEDLFTIGMDSIMIVQLKERILADKGINCEVSAFYNTLNSIERIEQHLSALLKDVVVEFISTAPVGQVVNTPVVKKAEAFVPFKSISHQEEEPVNGRDDALQRLIQDINKVTSAGDERTFRLSYPQQNIWWAEKLNPNTPDYNLAETFYIEGVFDLKLFGEACSLLVARHEILRTAFFERNGLPYQKVLDNVHFQIDEKHLSGKAELASVVREYINKCFDLSNPPLLRVLGGSIDTGHYLCIVIHHIACDGWALEVLFDELQDIYGKLLRNTAVDIEMLKMQYSDYLSYEDKMLSDVVLKSFWDNQVHNIKATKIEADNTSPVLASQGFAYAVISGNSYAGVKAIAAKWNTTNFVVLLALTKMLIGKYAAANEIIIGTPAPGRNKPGLAKLIGHCLNMLVLRNTIDSNEQFKTFVDRLHCNVLEAYEKQDYPFELLKNDNWKDRDTNKWPFFEVEVAMQNFRMRRSSQQLGVDGLSINAIAELSLDNRKYPLEFRFDEGQNDIELKLAFDPSMYSKGFIDNLIKNWQILLEAICNEPTLTIASLLQLVDDRKNDEAKDAINTIRKGGLSKLLSPKQKI